MTVSRVDELIATGLIDCLDAQDRVLLERPAQVKSADEEPSPLDPRGWWFAVPAEKYEGLFEALGPHDRFPVSLGEGADMDEADFEPGIDGTIPNEAMAGVSLACGRLWIDPHNVGATTQKRGQAGSRCTNPKSVMKA